MASVMRRNTSGCDCPGAPWLPIKAENDRDISRWQLASSVPR